MSKSVTKAAKAKAAKLITVCKNAQGAGGVLVQAGNGDSFVRPLGGDSKAFRAVALVGLPYAAALAYHTANPVAKPQAKLANGIAAKDAPHCAKAMADARGKAKPATTGKGSKARAAKADKAKQPSKGTDRAYKNAGRKDESKPDTFRRYMLSTIMAYKSTTDAKAAHAKSNKFPTHKLDFNWAMQQGYIAFTGK